MAAQVRPRWYTDSVAPLGSARECSLAHAVLWQGTGGCGKIGSAGSSLASPGRELALPGISRPAGSPKDPLFSTSQTAHHG